MSDPHPTDPSASALELRGVTHSYPGASVERPPILDDVDLRIAPGELVVVVGRSGSGKTTLLNLLSGIDLPRRGQIQVEGTDLTALDEEGRTRLRRRSIGLVFQFFNLVTTLTVGENVELPMELIGMPRDLRLERVQELLEEVGLADRADDFTDVLSGGEQQRVAIARALAHDPPVLLADEPTGNLDLDTGLRVLDLLDRLVRQRHKTMVMVTHAREVIGLADRILTVDHGHLIETDEQESLQASTPLPASTR